jgi:hypothetical protein
MPAAYTALSFNTKHNEWQFMPVFAANLSQKINQAPRIMRGARSCRRVPSGQEACSSRSPRARRSIVLDVWVVYGK